MNVIWRSLKANVYKMYYSKLLWIHLLIPLAAAVIFNLYFWGTLWSELEAVKLYMQVVAIAFPLMISIVTTLVYEADAEAGGFCMFLTQADRKAKGHIGNLLALLLYGSGACALAVIGFGVLYCGGTVLGRGVSGEFSGRELVLPLSFYAEITGLLFGVHIVSYLLQYLLCYTCGKTISLGWGIVELLLSPLLYLGIGDRIWKWIPCSYGIRMVSYDFILNEPNSGILISELNAADLDEYVRYFTEHVQCEWENGMRIIGGVTVLFGITFYLWGNKWEGKHGENTCS